MMISMALALVTTQTLASTSFKVVSVEKHVSFAGKLGNRVDLTFQVANGDHLNTIRVGRQHTRFGRVLEVKIGDRVELVEFHDVKTQTLMADHIRKVSN